MPEYIDREQVLKFLRSCYPAKWQGKLPDGRICHYSDVIDGVAAIPAADVEPAHKWFSVKDRLPETEDQVLAYYYFDKWGTRWRCVNVLTYFAFDEEPRWQHEGTGMVVTHWMPLQELPEEADNGAK